MAMSQLSFFGSATIGGLGAACAIVAAIVKDDQICGKPLLFGKRYKLAAWTGVAMFLVGIAWALIATHAF